MAKRVVRCRYGLAPNAGCRVTNVEAVTCLNTMLKNVKIVHQQDRVALFDMKSLIRVRYWQVVLRDCCYYSFASNIMAKADLSGRL